MKKKKCLYFLKYIYYHTSSRIDQILLTKRDDIDLNTHNNYDLPIVLSNSDSPPSCTNHCLNNILCVLFFLLIIKQI